MSFPLPCSLTPTKVTAFKDCAYSFRLSVIDKIPQPLSLWTVKGVIAHRVLERFYFNLEPGERNPESAMESIEAEWARAFDGGYAASFLSDLAPERKQSLRSEIDELILNLFAVEDPSTIRVIGTEIMLESSIGDFLARGVIDRLELDGNGELVVVDYKTGRPPSHLREQDKLAAVLFYALLVERVIGKRPRAVKLIYLKDRIVIETEVTPQRLKAVATRTSAVWHAVRAACETESFRPRPSRLCNFCAYRCQCPGFEAEAQPYPQHAAG